MNDSGSKQTTITFLVVLSLLIIGFFSALAKGDENIKSLQPQPTISSNNLHTKIASLYQEHITLLITALRHSYSDYPDTPAAHNQLHQNIQKIAEVIGSVKGIDAQTQFKAFTEIHDELFFNYVTAVKANNKQDLEVALENIRQEENSLLNLFTTINTHVSKDTLSKLLTQADILTQNSLDLYMTKNYDDSYGKEHDAEMTSTQLADVLDAGLGETK